ncbi:MAG TPA: hypothetical protein VGP71_04595 [Burkholderiales bacterium]|jgi:hypothetical protein|nr:hypothetical protein [Burkholderiales bacterium]
MTKRPKPSELERAVALLESGNWQAAHEIVQKDEDSRLSCWAHGIVHLMEGDRSNARYWYRQAKRPFPSEPSAANEIDALRKELSRQ